MKCLSVLLATLVLLAGLQSVTANDRALLNRMKGTYQGNKILVISLEGMSEAFPVTGQILLPRSKGQVSGFLTGSDSNGDPTTIFVLGRIKKIVCQRNKVIYTGTATLRDEDVAIRSTNFKAVAKPRGKRRERVRITALYSTTVTDPITTTVTVTGAFKGSK